MTRSAPLLSSLLSCSRLVLAPTVPGFIAGDSDLLRMPTEVCIEAADGGDGVALDTPDWFRPTLYPRGDRGGEGGLDVIGDAAPALLQYE